MEIFNNLSFNPIHHNLIPVNSVEKKPLIKWEQWEEEPICIDTYKKWNNAQLYRDGYGIITGKIWDGPHKGKYLICIDIDNKKGLEEFLSTYTRLKHITELAKITLVVQHGDALEERAHIYFITEKAIPKRSGICGVNKSKEKDPNLPAIEVKSDSSTFMIGPGFTHKNGNIYEIMGTKDILYLDETETKRLDDTINQIYLKYSAIKSSNNHIQNTVADHISVKPSFLYDELRNIAKELKINDIPTPICEGSRSNTLISFTRLLLNYHYKSSNDIQLLRDFLFRFNDIMIRPPLPQKEVENILNQDIKYFHKDMKENNIKNTNENNADDLYKNLCKKIPDKKFYDYIIKTTKKTVKQENSLVRLVTFCGLSTYTKHPLNLGIMAPTSEGKTYSVDEVIKYFPSQDIWKIGSMSPKVIVRDKGIKVDENYNPIGPKVLELRKKIEEEKEELKEQLESLINNSKELIDLTNKVLVFLEPPHQDTWNILKPVLSHDTFYIEHPYVYQTKSTGQGVKHIITKGWPACIFCSAKDESNWKMWPEIQSRFLITSPNMIKKKYSESNLLIGQKNGLPAVVQNQVIVSHEEISIAKDCITLLKNELLKNKENNVWIPFYQILSESLPSEKGPDVRMVDKVFSLLVLITKVNSFNRPKLIMGNEILAVSTPIDLEQVLALTHNLTGIPTHKLEFFIQVFMSRFKMKTTPDRVFKGSGDEIIEEEKIALTTSELAEHFKKVKGKPITTDNVNKTYLQELKNNGLVDETHSKIDGRRKIFFPLVEASEFDFAANTSLNQEIDNYKNLDRIDNNLHHLRLKLSDNYNKIDENWLELEILSLLSYGIGKVNTFKLIDVDDTSELCICRFVDQYNKFGSLNLYFKTDENCIYASKIFGKIIKQ